jgi:hypothetical protein
VEAGLPYEDRGRADGRADHRPCYRLGVLRWLTLAPLLSALACARILSYDEYAPRDGDDPLDAPASEGAVSDTLEDAGPPPARVPARPAGQAKPSGAGKTLWVAARRYTYGASEPSGAFSTDAWRRYGYDLDGTCTDARDSAENTDTCRRPVGANQDSLVDGEGCRDNNFGRNIARVFALGPTAEASLNDLVESGSTTWILRLDDVDPGVDDAYAPGALYRSSDDRESASPPRWDGKDDRAAAADSLLDADLARPALTFPKGYVASGVWVSGEPQALSVIAPISSVGFFPMKLAHARLTLELDAARSTGTRGLLVGAMAVPDLDAAFLELADFFRVCPGAALHGELLASLRATPDVVLGAPSLQDLGRTCNATSVAVAFGVAPIKPVTRVVPPLPPRRRRCSDAG